ncbi:hypothetical protein MC885_013052, partial [Smutsia gigantea]
GYNFIHCAIDVDFVENLDDFEIRDDDAFIITYPKSGTIWAQQLLSLIYFEEHHKGLANVETVDRVPYLEYGLTGGHFDKIPSPRLNPKDVMCSFFHFSNMLRILQPSTNMEEFMELFLKGKVLGSLWFDHIRGWYEHKSHFNIQFIMYEDMIKDLRSSILKVCKFWGKELSKEDMDAVVSQAMFENKKSDPRANYENVLNRLHVLRRKDGHFLRKGTIGDWKNYMTVAQNETFDRIFRRAMKDLPLKFIWDINEE